MSPIKINLGPVRLSFAIGDADHNGALDIVVGVRLSGFFEWVFPPVNLDAALAKGVADAFKAVSERIGGKK